MRYAITDEVRAVMGPMVDRRRSRLGPAPELPDRMSFEAVLDRARTGVPWRDPPEVIAVVRDEDGPIEVDIAEGQRNEAPLALPVLGEAKQAVGRIDEVPGACPDEHDALSVIPDRRPRGRGTRR